jgi:hypothetical protein
VCILDGLGKMLTWVVVSLVRESRSGRTTCLLLEASSAVFSLEDPLPGASFGKLVLIFVHLCLIFIGVFLFGIFVFTFFISHFQDMAARYIFLE